MITTQPLVTEIVDLALQIAIAQGPAVAVEFTSIANHLRVTAKHSWCEPGVIDESIELYLPDAPELTRRRVDRRLYEVRAKLSDLLRSCTIHPKPAA